MTATETSIDAVLYDGGWTRTYASLGLNPKAACALQFARLREADALSRSSSGDGPLVVGRGR